MNKEKVTILIVGFIMFCAMIVVLHHFNSATTTTKISLSSALLGLFAILFTQHSISQRRIQEAHRKKTEIYIEFLTLMATAMQSNVKERTKNDLKTQKSIMNFKTNIILWGSPEVIICYLKYEQYSGSTNNKKILLVVDNLYIAMRKDIGLSNKGLAKYDLIKMYLKDPSELNDI